MRHSGSSSFSIYIFQLLIFRYVRCLALQDETGTFIINGQHSQSKSGVYTVAGMDFRYTQSPYGPETLESVGPLVREATIMVSALQPVPDPWHLEVCVCVCVCVCVAPGKSLCNL